MSRLLRADLLLVAAVLAIAGVVAAFPRAEDEPGHLTITDDLEPLRAAFNSAPGNVRAILLASPT